MAGITPAANAHVVTFSHSTAHEADATAEFGDERQAGMHNLCTANIIKLSPCTGLHCMSTLSSAPKYGLLSMRCQGAAPATLTTPAQLHHLAPRHTKPRRSTTILRRATSIAHARGPAAHRSARRLVDETGWLQRLADSAHAAVPRHRTIIRRLGRGLLRHLKRLPLAQGYLQARKLSVFRQSKILTVHALDDPVLHTLDKVWSTSCPPNLQRHGSPATNSSSNLIHKQQKMME